MLAVGGEGWISRLVIMYTFKSRPPEDYATLVFAESSVRDLLALLELWERLGPIVYRVALLPRSAGPLLCCLFPF